MVAYPGVKEDDVFEIAALRFDESGEKEGLSITVNSGAALTDAMAEETGLTREMINGGVNLKDGLKQLYDFIGDGVKVIHDPLELNNLRQHGLRFDMELDAHCVSTSMLFHYLHRESKQTDMRTAAEALGVEHCGGRAMERARTAAKIMNAVLSEMTAKDIEKLPLI